MPKIDFTFTAGSLDDEAKQTLPGQLAAALLRWEGAPDTAFFRSISWTHVHELPAGAVHTADGVAEQSQFIVDVSVPQGALSDRRKAGLVEEATSLVRAAAGSATRTPSASGCSSTTWPRAAGAPAGRSSASSSSRRRRAPSARPRRPRRERGRLHAPLAVERVGGATVLRLTAGENRFNTDSVAAIEDALAAAAEDEAGGPLVITGEGKFFSNGLDLEWMGSAPEGEPQEVVRRVHGVFARVLAFPALTVAAINGHAFAGGAMLAMACDLRVMRADRGFFCLPEVDLGLPFTPGMTALLRARLSPATATTAMVLGRRFGGPDALAAGLVDEVADEAGVLDAALALAAEGAGKPRATVGAIKRRLHAEALAALEKETTA
jgi:enoyl-CoA hydratase/carnithine racemase/phenylpyruvate tautomerase PptA (4-oxalocrotonate tautomerase family)